MENTVYHVTLFGLEFDINRVAFTLPIGDGWPIYWYGILIAIGFLLALIYCLKRARPLGVDPDRMIDVVLVAAPVGIIGARAFYILFSDTVTFKDFFSIHEGGLAIYGGIIAAVLAGAVMCKIRKVDFFSMLDLAALGFLIGQCIGRWGNFFNQEAYGGYTGSSWWGMGSDKIMAEMDPLHGSDTILLVHPCFLYESLWCLIGFILLHILSKHRKFKGEIFLAYASFYGFGRMIIEGLRTDSLMLGSIRISQLIAGIAFVAGGAALLAILYKKKKAQIPTEYQPVFEEAIADMEAEAAVDEMDGDLLEDEGTDLTEDAAGDTESPAETAEDLIQEEKAEEQAEADLVQAAETLEAAGTEADDISDADTDKNE